LEFGILGESGLGKSTFLNSLFLADIHDISAEQAPELHHTVSIESKTVRLIENDVRLYLTVVDTPGFGDLVDNSEW
jgi:septin family protein